MRNLFHFHAYQGPFNEPSAEICPFCSAVVRDPHQIWLDALEERLLNERCFARILKAEIRKECQLDKDSVNSQSNQKVYKRSSKVGFTGPCGDQ
jgi:hypothetical protein